MFGARPTRPWDGELARTLSAYVLELAGVDHGFGSEGDDPPDTLDNLKRVVEAVAAFAALV